MKDLHNIPENHDGKLMRLASIASVSVALFLIFIKLIAYTLSGSIIMLSSLLDSFLDTLASIINLIAIRHALEPADEEHRFGHGKAEPLAGFAQAGFIIASSGFLLFEALFRINNPESVEHINISILVMVISTVITFLLFLFQRYVIKKTGSVAIEADSLHYLSDFLLNLAVIIALLLMSYYQNNWIDPLFAIGVAIYILMTARKILIKSLNQLMDRELENEDRRKIEEIILAHEYVIDFHELRTRLSGRDIFIQFHLDLDRNMSLSQAHDVSDKVRKSLIKEFPEADILIHQDPT